MERKHELNPEVSPQELTHRLQVIEEALHQARIRLQRNSGEFIFWGAVVMMAGLVHYGLAVWGRPPSWIGLAYLLIFGGATLGSLVYHLRRHSRAVRPERAGGFFMMAYSVLLAVNMFAVGFSHHLFGPLTMTVLLVVLAVAMMGWATFLRSWSLLKGAVMVNILAYVALKVDAAFHPLIMAAAGLLGLVVPGMWLKKYGQ